MTAAAYQLAGVISAKREGRYHKFKDVEREEPSILAHVMGVTQEVSICHYNWVVLMLSIDYQSPATCTRSV
jgi:hypothetical protein